MTHSIRVGIKKISEEELELVKSVFRQIHTEAPVSDEDEVMFHPHGFTVMIIGDETRFNVPCHWNSEHAAVSAGHIARAMVIAGIIEEFSIRYRW
jgi:hypothetical protein